ncbi:MAG: amino acid adenylation domain-containing protein [Coriobacteriales bacterium]|jgi:D-alanine--poly(phosphoribitol) ligase subunit 1
MNNVLEWLEDSAREHPEKLAFADVDERVTWSELELRSRAVGSAIAARVEPRRPVAIYLDKSVAAICTLLGAVQAGCCYSFIDLRQPQPRVEKIAARLDPALVIVDEQGADQAAEMFPEGTEFVRVEEMLSQPVDEELLAARRGQALSTDPVYINFTSGSTGEPKGVAVGHASIIDFIPVFTKTLGLTHEDVFANQAPLDFDVSVKDIYGALFLGATVHLIPREYFSIPTQLLDYLCEREPTVLVWAVSAMCFVSIMKGFEYKVPSSVKKVIFSGEVMPVKQLNIWREFLPDATFVNVYGPTEITCNCTYFTIDRSYEPGDTIPMGRAFANENVFLVDAEGCEVVEPGVEGEILVGGATLALGYYRDPERTAEAFVQNPLHHDYRDIVYRTGDLASYDDEGNLVYLSRKDHQIKHMGQRIELGEIESAAQAVEGVEQACCLYDGIKKRILLHYAGGIDRKELGAVLREKLPQYMVPNKIRQHDMLPLTKNGKIDRKKLAE